MYVKCILSLYPFLIGSKRTSSLLLIPLFDNFTLFTRFSVILRIKSIFVFPLPVAVVKCSRIKNCFFLFQPLIPRVSACVVIVPIVRFLAGGGKSGGTWTSSPNSICEYSPRCIGVPFSISRSSVCVCIVYYLLKRLYFCC